VAASSKPKAGKVDSGASAGPERSGLEALSDAIQSGAGLPAITRAASSALDASIALIDRSSAVLAVAAGSSAEEEKLLASGTGVETIELRVADQVVGELRWRDRTGGAGGPVALRMVTTLLGLEVERARSPDWASDEAAHDFIKVVLRRELTDPGDIIARAGELGSDLSGGAGVIMARAAPHAAQAGDWRARALMLTLRAVRSGSSGALASAVDGEGGEVATLIPSPDAEGIARAAKAIEDELRSALHGFSLTLGYSRHAPEPLHLYRAGKEALLAANVGEVEGISPMAFEDTGAYRLLLPALSEDPAELERFFDETVAPLAAYDDQYETELVATVEAYLDNDGNVTPTAETLFTHRHTVRYRLERVKELCGHDLTSTDGREKMGLGLKAMRVLGIPSPGGPALEPGTKGGRPRRNAGE